MRPPSHVVSVLNKVLIISFKDIFCSLFVEAGIMCYQPSSHDCFKFAYILKFVATNTTAIQENRWQSLSDKLSWYNQTIYEFFIYKTVGHFDFFPYRKSS
jgi:hypothetical protein